jgi:hypothetical protein
MEQPVFKKEYRYIVFKLSDITNIEKANLELLNKHVNERRQAQGKQPLKSLVLEKDWPEYELAEDALKMRMLEEYGHTPHCVARQTWGDGECECKQQPNLTESEGTDK